MEISSQELSNALIDAYKKGYEDAMEKANQSYYTIKKDESIHMEKNWGQK